MRWLIDTSAASFKWALDFLSLDRSPHFVSSFCKTPLTYRWLIWFRLMLSSAFLLDRMGFKNNAKPGYKLHDQENIDLKMLTISDRGQITNIGVPIMRLVIFLCQKVKNRRQIKFKNPLFVMFFLGRTLPTELCQLFLFPRRSSSLI